MNARFAIAAAAAAFLSSMPAGAQPADLPIQPATTSAYPPGVSVGKAGIPVYVWQGRHTLYGMDMRTLLREGPNPAQYCKGSCAELWAPLLAPADAKPNVIYPLTNGANPDYIPNQKAPDWTIITGPQGPQWVYKGWHMVFTRKGEAAGSAVHDGEEDRRWNTLKFRPPVPQVTAPVNVAPTFVAGGYALSDEHGGLLFTGRCTRDCAAWRPLAGGMASRGTGDWTVTNAGDTPQWHYRGKPVFVAAGATPADLPAGGALLRP